VLIKKQIMKTQELDFPFLFKTIKSLVGGYTYKDGIAIFSIPGFSKQDIKISLDGRTMHITGKKEISDEEYEIDRKFVLPEGTLNSNDPITAKVENGLLYIYLKKTERARQKVVEIS
jgi:HSP20 family molecular chaperone IbpA